MKSCPRAPRPVCGLGEGMPRGQPRALLHEECLFLLPESLVSCWSLDIQAAFALLLAKAVVSLGTGGWKGTKVRVSALRLFGLLCPSYTLPALLDG